MLIIIGIILIFVGALLLFNPKAVFYITESWKSYSSSEPSNLYLISTRIGGAIMCLVGITGIIILLFV